MYKITALLHVSNDAPRLGRALDSLRVCDELLVVDHGSEDDTLKIAQSHGATIKKAIPGVENGAYATDARHDWILCVLPCEALSEGLEASLLGWKHQTEGKDHPETEPDHAALAFALRKETDGGWEGAPPQTRLVNRRSVNWTSTLPPETKGALVLPGDLLHFRD
jgi:glycosyltransferase involved in cell wall biosynthesis